MIKLRIKNKKRKCLVKLKLSKKTNHMILSNKNLTKKNVYKIKICIITS